MGQGRRRVGGRQTGVSSKPSLLFRSRLCFVTYTYRGAGDGRPCCGAARWIEQMAAPTGLYDEAVSSFLHRLDIVVADDG
jgi:hypothetical protein